MLELNEFFLCFSAKMTYFSCGSASFSIWKQIACKFLKFSFLPSADRHYRNISRTQFQGNQKRMSRGSKCALQSCKFTTDER